MADFEDGSHDEEVFQLVSSSFLGQHLRQHSYAGLELLSYLKPGSSVRFHDLADVPHKLGYRRPDVPLFHNKRARRLHIFITGYFDLLCVPYLPFSTHWFEELDVQLVKEKENLPPLTKRIRGRSTNLEATKNETQ